MILKSKWQPGARVRVKAGLDSLSGETGTVEDVCYAKVSEETSVILDMDPDGPGAWFYDHELEAE
ncbi:hypothetical protein ACIRVF_11175 [Kitasatospora sp. NPDC101157]|uniref:hypothetical protein n=1 Tax=Kitasatospora sp. NPDC101157 TaxID=3364098 RepID=UPI0037F466DC